MTVAAAQETGALKEFMRQRALDSRKEDVIRASILFNEDTDAILARRLNCSVRTVHKWRRRAHQFVCVVDVGGDGAARMKLRARLKRPVCEMEGGNG